MIDFSNFYQLIAKSPLSHWLETLPARSRGSAMPCTASFVNGSAP
ncbi:hypothetical protein KPZU09_01650 [Klebsiella pneumoniae]|uniref:tRNA (5-methoxyuridine) 34 synthase n=1 Tax=Klebsiella pneumoniae TaxID=573 RepID=A0A919LQ58_KLEPN|nr:hypothetical protein KPZU09_01650 [Klebsiella pneumoniae]